MSEKLHKDTKMNFLQTSSDIKIETYFHPIISLKDRTIVAFEALSRFKTPLDTTFKSISELMSIIRKESFSANGRVHSL